MKVLDAAIRQLQQGGMVILTDDNDRENEGDLVLAAEFANADNINFMLQQARGVICLSLTQANSAKLRLEQQPMRHTNATAARFTISIDAVEGVSTGVSALDRAQTIQTAINPKATPQDIATPGHVFPLLAEEWGVLRRRGHTEGSIDLAKIAGLRPAAVICEILNEDGGMARDDALQAFAEKHQLPIVSIQDIVTYRWQQEAVIRAEAQTIIPTPSYGNLTLRAFVNPINGEEALAIHSNTFIAGENCPVRVHSSCLTGDLFASLRCDCGDQLQQALAIIAQENGVLIYVLQEGRGIGLVNKLKAYELQDQGLDTVEANLKLGFAADERDFAVAAQIITYLQIPSIQLLTNNPEKCRQLEQYGVNVAERRPLVPKVTPENANYLKTKQNKLNHSLTL